MEFYGIDLLTAPGRVMTPRRATEALVDRALELIGERPLRVADVGTGSGAIAVALGLRAPQAEIWATDQCTAAVDLAAANIVRLGLAERVFAVAGDLLDPVPGELDVVVANLPYLPAREASSHPELDGEPVVACYAPGDGFGPLRRLFAQAYDRLCEGGALLYQYRGEAYEARCAELPLLQSPAWHAVAARS